MGEGTEVTRREMDLQGLSFWVVVGASERELLGAWPGACWLRFLRPRVITRALKRDVASG